jgi:EmrB/QacA subfamily drug resistance transporter
VTSSEGLAPTPTVESSIRRWWILIVICLAQLMDGLDVTIVNIALPHAQQELGFTVGQRQWVVTAYALAFGTLLLLFGRISDLLGRRTTLLVGLLAFAAASALGGFAATFGVLVTARAMQGAAGAMIAPAALALLSTTFVETKERGRAFAIFGGVAGSGAAVGMILGGVLTQFLDWRWTLFVNVVIATAAIVGTIILIPRQPEVSPRPRLDLLGTLLVSTGLFGIVYGFSNVDLQSWSAPITWGSLGGGVVLLAAFVWWQTAATQPLLPLRVILDRTRGGANLAIFLAGIGLFSTFLFLNYFLQTVLQFTPLFTGLAFLPMVVALVIAGGVCTTQLYPRFGPRAPITGGMLAAAIGMASMTGIGPGSSYPVHALGPLILFGVGIGAIVAPAMNAGTLRIPPKDAGTASAVLVAAQQIGGSIGIALLNSIAASELAHHLSTDQAASKTVTTAAAIHSYSIAFWCTSAIFVAGAIISGVTFPGSPPDGAATKPA